MEWNPQTLQFLSDCFLNTLSPLPEPRRRAESALSDAADKPNFALAVLRLVAEPSVDEQIRQAAAVTFKNHLKSRWVPAGSDANDSNAASVLIPDAEKAQIKALIVSLMVNSSPRIQAQLSEALAVIGKHDFPQLWPTLLPELVDSLDRLSLANDYASVNGALVAVSSLFEKFRFQFKTNELLFDLKYCLDNFAKPLLLVFQRTAALLDQAAASVPANPAALKLYIDSQRLCCEIFYSLNFQDLPEFFEDHMSEWMSEFRKYLTVKYPALEDVGNDGMAVVDELRAAVCENISLYMEKEEELFQVYLGGFVEAVWGLLLLASPSPSREKLTVTAIKFLTTVSTSVHHALFGSDAVLQQIVQGVVIPNVMLRDEEEELFDMNYVEFISRDMEGSDMDTRRRVACELLKGMGVHYKEKVTQRISAEIQGCLDYFSKNPDANWKHKDCAIYLVVSLATRKAGGASFSTDLVDVESFFASVIVPELRSPDVNASPMLKAGALKFFTMFRNQIPKPIALALLPDVVRFLNSESNVVHSYAATCIEKLLLVKDDSKPRYTAADIGPFFQPLVTNLFAALKKQESEENQYVMKCIMRVLGVAEIPLIDAFTCINELSLILRRVCQDPKSQVFNHYLFESLAALIRRASQTDSSAISSLEAGLFPSIEIILSQGISEFFPYAFQLLAQLVELTHNLQNYAPIFEILLSPDLWSKSANVPALVYLLQAFLRRSPEEMMVQQGKLKNVLGIFSGLVSVSSSDAQGFYVLNTVIENVGYDAIQPHLTEIWVTLFNRLRGNLRQAKFVKNLVIFMSLFLIRFGADKLVASVNAVQNNLFHTILEQFWIPNLEKITGFIELKLTSVASTRLIRETPSIWESGLAGKLLNSIITLVSRSEQQRAVEDELEVPDFGETSTGYNASFARLYNVGKKEDDPLKEIKDPKQFLVASLKELRDASPGMFNSIKSSLDQANQAAFYQLCAAFNMPLS
ncbi:OLC1v1038364C1 [Oldenlandia corymbosa var. corymbosa]|uniref:OLC1v1038364C1 n=1 Tax=Oldenlandia corymbosa var. corymbosa TaxID=529605 RepID=A0AAV1CZP3_OLDCO|nr:OLC1v1038364C1 [Oldenlandia corymbosa var. corymbosa]